MADDWFDKGPVGSVGSLVAAALETAGHSLQSAVLDFFGLPFQEGFLNDLGLLIYMCAAIGALFVVAIGGNYKFGLWFFVGPTLCFFLLFPRVGSKGVAWTLGAREFDSLYVEAATVGVTEEWLEYELEPSDNPNNPPVPGNRVGEGNKVGEVSWFFAWWSNFTSEVVRTFVKMLHLDVANADLSLLNKVQRYHALMKAEIENPTLRAFINLVLVGDCNEYFGLETRLFRPGARLNSNYLRREEYKQNYVDPIGRGASGPKISGRHRAILDAVEQKLLLKPDNTPITEGELQDYYNCEEIWQFGTRAVVTDAHQIFASVAGLDIPDGMTLDDVKKQIIDRVGTKIIHADGSDTPLTEDQKLFAFVNEMAARMIFREFRQIRKNVLASEVDQHTPVHYYATEDQASEDIREAFQGLEYESKGIYLSTILALPYLQGLTLYILGLSYPFFALALIFPGRHWAFLRWMALWFWVKSWDLGFAVVMILDQLLYNLLPHGPPVMDEIKDPAVAFKTILEVDPAYGVQTYFNLLATLLAAVPVVTGVLVKRGGSEIVHAVNQGFQNFSGKIGFAMMQYHTSNRNQDIADRQVTNEIFAFRRAKEKALSDPEVQAAIAFEFASSGAMKLLDPKDRKGLAKFANEFGQGVTREVGMRYARSIATKKMNQNLMRAIYNESQSIQYIRGAYKAIVNYYSNHDWITKHPYGSEIAVMKARKDIQPGGAVQSGMKSLFFKPNDSGKDIGRVGTPRSP